MAQRQIPFGVLTLRTGYRPVIMNVIVTTKLPYEILDGILRLVIKTHQPVRHHQRAGIDEGVAGNTALIFQLHQRVEGITRRLPPDSLPDTVAHTAYHHRQGKDLGDALYGEALPGIAHGAGTPIQRFDSDPIPARIHLGQCGDIIRPFPCPQRDFNSSYILVMTDP